MKNINLSKIFILAASWVLMAGLSYSAEQSPVSYLLDIEPTKAISMDFKDAKLNDVLKLFSQQSGLNFIADSTIADKTVNLYMDNVPVEEALERILSANGLTYEMKEGSNIFVVKQLDLPAKNLMTRVYHLKFATVSKSKLNTTLSISSTDSSSSSSSSSEEGSSSGVYDAIKAILTKDVGSIIEDTRTNSIIVTDIPSQFQTIEQTIARMDIRVPQILIEVEMLDVSKNTAELLGAKWGGAPIQFSGAKKDGAFPFDFDNILNDINNVGATPPTVQEKFSTDPQYTVSTLSFAGLSFTLNFLRTQTDTKNLARPRILTLNNEKASIQISVDEAIGVKSVTSSVAGGAALTTAEADRKPTGVFLYVTPQANITTGEITMAVEPKVIQAKTGASFTVGTITQTFKDVEERSTKSILRVKDGDTIIIGGLLRTDVSDIRTKVPGLSNVPLIGAAFRHKDKSGSERELIVFITPHIIDENFDPRLNPSNEKIVREQDIPTKKSKQIDEELSQVEKQRL